MAVGIHTQYVMLTRVVGIYKELPFSEKIIAEILS